MANLRLAVLTKFFLLKINKFRMRGNIHVHFFVNTITDIIYWNFHVFIEKCVGNTKIILSSSPSPPIAMLVVFMLQSLLHAVTKSFVLASIVQTRKNNSLLYL